MATDEALAYLVALGMPVRLLVEQAVTWLRSRWQDGRQQEDAEPAIRVGTQGVPGVTRKAA